MCFPDLPIPEQKESYISSDKMMEYLDLYTDTFSIRQYIKFLHYVMRIRPINNEWEVNIFSCLLKYTNLYISGNSEGLKV